MVSEAAALGCDTPSFSPPPPPPPPSLRNQFWQRLVSSLPVWASTQPPCTEPTSASTLAFTTAALTVRPVARSVFICTVTIMTVCVCACVRVRARFSLSLLSLSPSLPLSLSLSLSLPLSLSPSLSLSLSLSLPLSQMKYSGGMKGMCGLIDVLQVDRRQLRYILCS